MAASGMRLVENVVQLPRPKPSEAAIGAAMHEAREVAGLDLAEAAERINQDLGCTVIGIGLLNRWETGSMLPPVDVMLAAIRLAGREAPRILACLL